MSLGGGGGGSTKIKDTPEQKYAAQIAAEKWNFAQEQLAPLENEYMASIDQLGSGANSDYLKGTANQGMQAGLSQGLTQARGALAQSGIDPSSGRGAAGVTSMGLGAASAGGDTASRALASQDQAQMQGYQNVLQLGSGQETMATTGINTLAATSSGDAINNAANAYNRKQANLQLLGTAAGMGYGAYANGGGVGAPTTVYNEMATR